MKNKKLKLNELKVTSFVTEVKPESTQTIKGGTWEIVCMTISIVESIHEIGDERSWWHCGGTGSGGGEISDVVVLNNTVQACAWKPVIVEG